MIDDELPHFAAPPDPDALVRALGSLTNKWGDVADELKKLTSVYERDRRFRRWVTGVLAVMTVAGLVVGGIAISTALRLQERIEPDKVESCLRGNAFRQDVYVANDAALDRISEAVDEDARAVLTAAKAEYRKKIPLRDCG